MAKRVKFPLNMGKKDGTNEDIMVRNLNELKENYNTEKVMWYFSEGKLLTWLEDRYCDDEAEQVRELMEQDCKDAVKVGKIFGVEIKEDIDVEKLEIRRERLEKLRNITGDDEILNNVDYVAFSQNELVDLLDEEAKVIYLCGENFRIPMSVKNVRCVGVNNPPVSISGTGDIIRENNEKFVEKEKGISIERCKIPDEILTEIMKKANDSLVIEKYGTSEDLSKNYAPKNTVIENTEDFVTDVYGSTVCLRKYIGTTTNVMIPNKFTKIGTAAFSMCENIESVLIQDSVTEIESYAFMQCTNLKSLTFSKNITAINESSFYGCKSLANVYIPYGVTIINDNAFNGCYNLQNVYLPNTVCKIGKDVFDWCQNIKVTYKNRTYGSEEINDLYNAVNNIPQSPKINTNDFEIVHDGGKVCLKKYKGNSEVVKIPAEVNIIGREAFYNCKGVKQIIIPDSVFEIGGWAFSKCENLESINISDRVTKIDYNTFEDCKSLKALTIPNTLTEIKSNAFYGCDKYNFKVYYRGRAYTAQNFDILYGYINR